MRSADFVPRAKKDVRAFCSIGRSKVSGRCARMGTELRGMGKGGTETYLYQLFVAKVDAEKKDLGGVSWYVGSSEGILVHTTILERVVSPNHRRKEIICSRRRMVRKAKLTT